MKTSKQNSQQSTQGSPLIFITIFLALIIVVLLVVLGFLISDNDQNQKMDLNQVQTPSDLDDQDNYANDLSNDGNQSLDTPVVPANQTPETPVVSDNDDQEVDSSGVLPDNWEQLSNSEKTDLNPLNCNKSTHFISAENGSCILKKVLADSNNEQNVADLAFPFKLVGAENLKCTYLKSVATHRGGVTHLGERELKCDLRIKVVSLIDIDPKNSPIWPGVNKIKRNNQVCIEFDSNVIRVKVVGKTPGDLWGSNDMVVSCNLIKAGEEIALRDIDFRINVYSAKKYTQDDIYELLTTRYFFINDHVFGRVMITLNKDQNSTQEVSWTIRATAITE